MQVPSRELWVCFGLAQYIRSFNNFSEGRGLCLQPYARCGYHEKQKETQLPPSWSLYTQEKGK